VPLPNNCCCEPDQSSNSSSQGSSASSSGGAECYCQESLVELANSTVDVSISGITEPAGGCGFCVSRNGMWTCNYNPADVSCFWNYIYPGNAGTISVQLYLSGSNIMLKVSHQWPQFVTCGVIEYELNMGTVKVDCSNLTSLNVPFKLIVVPKCDAASSTCTVTFHIP
jgi:hypothetical protein